MRTTREEGTAFNVELVRENEFILMPEEARPGLGLSRCIKVDEFGNVGENGSLSCTVDKDVVAIEEAVSMLRQAFRAVDKPDEPTDATALNQC